MRWNRVILYALALFVVGTVVQTAFTVVVLKSGGSTFDSRFWLGCYALSAAVYLIVSYLFALTVGARPLVSGLLAYLLSSILGYGILWLVFGLAPDPLLVLFGAGLALAFITVGTSLRLRRARLQASRVGV